MSKPKLLPDSKPKGRYQVKGDLAVDLHQAAEITGFSVGSLRARVNRHIIPFRRAGGRILFSRRDLEQWFDSLPGVSVSQACRNQEERRL